MIRVAVLLVMTLGMLPLVATAQAPPAAPACDDDLRATRIHVEAVTLSQIRERGDAARAIGALQKRLEQLAVEVETLKKAAKPTPAEPK